VTGSSEQFKRILKAYKILSSDRDRKIYDYAFESYHKNQNTLTSDIDKKITALHPIPPSRIIFTQSVRDFAKKGLMRKGYRMKDRKKWTGIIHDVDVQILESEQNTVLHVQIPLTVRILCPGCMGSDIHCSACGGNGSYKSFRNLTLDLIPTQWQSGQILDIDLSHLRPDRFTYFKKKKIKVRLVVIPIHSKSLQNL
jgi:DnaJ-class molecular chaperone